MVTFLVFTRWLCATSFVLFISNHITSYQIIQLVPFNHMFFILFISVNPYVFWTDGREIFPDTGPKTKHPISRHKLLRSWRPGCWFLLWSLFFSFSICLFWLKACFQKWWITCPVHQQWNSEVRSLKRDLGPQSRQSFPFWRIYICHCSIIHNLRRGQWRFFLRGVSPRLICLEED